MTDGIDVEGRLYVSERAHLVLPYHKLVDAASAASKAIGTTGRGIGPAYEDKIARRGVRVLDLRHPERLRELVERRAPSTRTRSSSASASDERADVDDDARAAGAPRAAAAAARRGRRARACTARSRAGAAVLLEGAQGSLLDIDHGTYPFVTSSNTTSGGAAIGVGIGPTAIDAVLGVVKAYTTRVGNGPLPTELDGAARRARCAQLGNEFGATTGRARRCGWFDAVVVRYAARVNGLTGLAVTKLDVLDTLDAARALHGLRDRRRRCTRSFPATSRALERAVPRYEWFDGLEAVHGRRAHARPTCRTRRARYLDRIEALVRGADHVRQRGDAAGPDHRRAA